MRRLQISLLAAMFLTSNHSASASDWVEDDTASPPSLARTKSEPISTVAPYLGGATPGTIASSGLRLHFAQAIDALELEIFNNRNTKSGINERLDLLEKAVFGDTVLEELSNNMQRLHRLLSTIALSDFNVLAAAGKAEHAVTDGESGGASMSSQNAGTTNRNGFWRTIMGVPRDTAGGVNKVLHSPMFWTLVGVSGALVCGYLLARRYGTYYDNPCVSHVNPNQHYVRPVYNASGQLIRNGYWATNPNSTMTDNFSSTCNVNPFTGQLGWIPPIR